MKITKQQTDIFLEHYASKPLRVAAAAAGIDVIQATVLAKKHGCLRTLEAAIINSPQGEQGRMGEEMFQAHLPQAINCNTHITYANPAYDFILNGLKIDVKCSAGSERNNGKRSFPVKMGNALKTDLFVIFVKADKDAPNEESSYRHCFIIPSLFLLSVLKLEIAEKAIFDSTYAWHEYCYPIEKLREVVTNIAENKEAFAIPEEVRTTADAHRKLKKEINRGKQKRNSATA